MRKKVEGEFIKSDPIFLDDQDPGFFQGSDPDPGQLHPDAQPSNVGDVHIYNVYMDPNPDLYPFIKMVAISGTVHAKTVFIKII